MPHNESVPAGPPRAEHGHRRPSDDAAITAASLTEQISSLRAETVAAVEQRQVLAIEARRALIDALRRGLICRPGCEDALATWGLEPLPQRWTISADGQLSYIWEHTDLDDALQQACFGVPDELSLLHTPIAVYPRQAIDVSPAPDGNDCRPEATRYRITVRVTVRTWMTATCAADAQVAARTAVEGELPMLAAAGITLTGLTWQHAEGSDDVPLDDADADVHPVVASTVQPTDVNEHTASAARDAAVEALADLRRRIRVRAISALVDDELGGDYRQTAMRVNRFLVDLGLGGLPRAHHLTVLVDLALRVGDGTTQDACDAARNLMQAVTVIHPDKTRRWTAYGRPRAEYATIDQDGWRMPWQHEYEIWLRDQATSVDATAAAEALVRADLTRALASVDHELFTVSASVEDVGIDLFLDPDQD